MRTKTVSSAKDVLKAGFAKVDITPPVGIGLAGYASRTGPSKAVGQPLYSKAIVLESGNTTVCIAANDLLFVTAALANGVRMLVQERIGIPPEYILLSATCSSLLRPTTGLGRQFPTRPMRREEASQQQPDSALVRRKS